MGTHHQIETRDPQQRDSLLQLRVVCRRDDAANLYEERLPRGTHSLTTVRAWLTRKFIKVA